MRPTARSTLNLIVNAIQAMRATPKVSANYISKPTTPSRKVCGSPCEHFGPGLTRISFNVYSSHSTRQSPMAWGGTVDPPTKSSKRTEDGSGRAGMRHGVLYFSLPYLPILCDRTNSGSRCRVKRMEKRHFGHRSSPASRFAKPARSYKQNARCVVILQAGRSVKSMRLRQFNLKSELGVRINLPASPSTVPRIVEKYFNWEG